MCLQFQISICLAIHAWDARIRPHPIISSEAGGGAERAQPREAVGERRPFGAAVHLDGARVDADAVARGVVERGARLLEGRIVKDVVLRRGGGGVEGVGGGVECGVVFSDMMASGCD